MSLYSERDNKFTEEDEIEWITYTEEKEEDWIKKENKKYICGGCGWSAYPVEGMLKEIIGLPQKYCDSCYNKTENQKKIMTDVNKKTKFFKCEKCQNKRECYKVEFLAGHDCEVNVNCGDNWYYPDNHIHWICEECDLIMEEDRSCKNKSAALMYQSYKEERKRLRELYENARHYTWLKLGQDGIRYFLYENTKSFRRKGYLEVTPKGYKNYCEKCQQVLRRNEAEVMAYSRYHGTTLCRECFKKVAKLMEYPINCELNINQY
ncbi:hypothetical protein RclHR1_04790005 [Rhizophagus clarus]|uniref:Uncharacterized protein n=1 Tax=Rhizophagus clarus TaxID=94130 RepID=A0A2Z6RJ95_9GLOM|nr:hypothetical protein RclHR1_04790005 [Rhizophagus clarus]GES95892.1 hypothetical protein RCL_jg256.t1 [Rhizophagus clarus]